MQSSTSFQRMNLRNIFDFRDLTLSIGLILSCIGAYLFQISPFIQSMVTTLFLLNILCTLGSSLYIYFTQHSPQTINSRMGAFLLFCFSTGLGFGPLLQMVAFVNPGSIPTALLATTFIFISFSLAALLTRKRYYLFLGGALMSAISILTTFSLMNLFIRSPAIYQAELYIGLVIFCAFVVFDTQMIVQKRRAGDSDFIWHTLDLFIDLVEIFRHLLIILNSKRRNRDEE